jgi:lactate dehydrogenase-like 2-hydroxyacid dehydrogenase
MNKKVAIIGAGFVGKAMNKIFTDAYIYGYGV